MDNPEVDAVLANQARAAREAAVEKEHHDFIPDNPWRVLDGETNYVKINGVEFCGKVLEVQPDGVRISGNYGDLFTTHYFANIEDDDKNQEFFVANLKIDAAENEIVPETDHYMAYYVGTYTYTTVQGSSRTIRKLDYGTPCPTPELTPEQIAAAKALNDAAKARADYAQARVVALLQSEATNGIASSQFRLGEHYLKGLGCETNVELGIYWIKKAAAQGSFEASNKLETIQSGL